MKLPALLICCSALFWATPAESSPNPFAAFGGSVVLMDDTAFVSEASGFHKPGQVHVLRRQESGSWVIDQTLSARDGFVGDRFGTSVAVSAGFVVVGATSANDGRGNVVVFSLGADGRYAQSAVLRPPSLDNPAGFGSAVAIVGDAVVVGAPRADNQNGEAHAFVQNGDEWVLLASLSPYDAPSGFGTRLASDGAQIAISAPSASEGAGAVHVFEWTGSRFEDQGSVSGSEEGGTRFASAIDLDGGKLLVGASSMENAGAVLQYMSDGDTWVAMSTTFAPDGLGDRARFGSTVQFDGDAIWSSAPGAAGGGVVVRTGPGGDQVTIAQEGLTVRPSFGGGFAAAGDLLVVGAAGDAYGEGTAFFYAKGEEEWTNTWMVFNETAGVAEIAGAEVECRDGNAGDYNCEGVDLLAFLPNDLMEINRGVRLNDVWGWTDPETDREYALVGHMEAMAIVDVSDPTGPVYLGTLPRTEGSPGSTWRDIKVYRDHAFIVADGAGAHGMQIFDLRQLRDLSDIPVQFEPTAFYDRIASAHNVVINEETGFAYTVGNSSGGETCGGGLHMIDIREPANPSFVGCFTHEGTNNSGGGATHDAQCITYQGPDTDHRDREICVSSNGAALSVSDVTNKSEPVAISQATYPNHAYVHQGWFTDDQRYFYQNDEGDEVSGVVEKTRTMIWDMTDLDDPQMIGEFYGSTNATDHNLYVDGNLMYQTNNSSGLRIIDISDPETPVEIGHFDTTPYGNDDAGFNGTWSSYPYFGSGTLVVTSRREGLFMVRKRNIDT